MKKDLLLQNVEKKEEIKKLSEADLPITKKMIKELENAYEKFGKTFVSFVEKWNRKIIERVFYIYCKGGYDEKVRRCEDNGYITCRNIYLTQISGYHCVDTTKKRTNSYYWNTEDNNKWWTSWINYFNLNEYRAYTQEDIQKMYKRYQYFTRSNSYKNYLDSNLIVQLAYFSKYPYFEKLNKIGYSYLSSNTTALKQLEKNSKLFKYMCRNASEFTPTKQSFNTIKYCFKNNCKVSDYIRYLNELEIANKIKKTFDEIKNKITNLKLTDLNALEPKKVYDYTTANKINLNDYFDFIKAVVELKLDLSQDKNKYPHDFKYWHDLYTAQVVAMKNEKIDKGMLQTANKYNFLNFENKKKGFICIVAQNSQELINEGEAQHICVGRMNYNQKQAEGNCVIVFVRKIDEPNTPLATLEYNPKSNQIVQLRGKYNASPSDELCEFVNKTWFTAIKKSAKQLAQQNV